MSDIEKIQDIIESIIFVSDTPVTLNELAGLFNDIERKEVREAINNLEKKWEELNRSFTLQNIAGGYQFRTKSEYSEYIIEFNKKIKKFRLSRAALEVLAIKVG